MRLTKLSALFPFIVGLVFLGIKINSTTIYKNHLKHTSFLFNNCKTTISGKILDLETKTPITDASITLILNGQKIKMVSVSENGEYSFKINCDKRYKIRVKAASYFNLEFDFIAEKDKATPIFKNFLLEKACYQTITGTISNSFSKKIINNATVTLYLKGEKIETTKSNEVGVYNFKVKCNSNYSIVVNKLNFIDNTFKFSTSNLLNKIIKHPFNLEPECMQIISGVIKNKLTLEPVSATLKLYLNNIEIGSLNVKNDGKYLVKFQCTTNYKIIASKPDHKEDSYNFLTDYIENKQPDYFHLKKDLFLEPNQCFQVVLGKVLDKQTKKIIPNALVSLYYQNQKIKTFQTNFDGSYFFNVKCDVVYNLAASKAGMKTTTVNHITSEKKGDDKTLNIYLENEKCDQIVNGFILDKNTQLPIPNTKVTLLENNLFVNSVVTNQKGAFTFNTICDTNYKITANNSEYSSNSISFSTDKNLNGIKNVQIELLKKKSNCVQYLKGIVNENITNNAIPEAKITLLNRDKVIKSTFSDSNGTFFFEMSCDKNYTLSATKSNYTSAKETISTFNKIGRPHNVNLILEPIIKTKEKNGVKYIETKPIDFELDEYELTNDAKIELNKIIFNLNQNPNFKLEINYYTDSRGPDNYNMELTQKRADASKNYLISKGINPARIKATGFGETHLLNRCKNNVKCTDAEHAINRRTEFIILPN
ncbi:MAG: carboxypeptidase regulatory-like domain-containing protein [Lutibacter sp.]|uniref:carboxypeptidase regulatory-like domain-containing protein n=1 Tax=Lutibacter sp. TaxID=1925666 RepID=UPI00299E9E71|nr:carboxypeptidase regulatory-like domain-containing protein [Lutibacter sp.]MDX1830345.1 carboxypeptidase regulatory-like domain-containing protein [Lutibacter sp.]